MYQSFWTVTDQISPVPIPRVLRSPIVRKIAFREGKSVQHVMYRYCIDVGIVPLCGTTKEERMKSDISFLDWEGLTKEDIRQIDLGIQ